MDDREITRQDLEMYFSQNDQADVTAQIQYLKHCGMAVKLAQDLNDELKKGEIVVIWSNGRVSVLPEGKIFTLKKIRTFSPSFETCPVKEPVLNPDTASSADLKSDQGLPDPGTATTTAYDITLYLGGVSCGNPGPSGIGVIMESGGSVKKIARAIGNISSTRCELMALIEALNALKYPQLSNVHAVSSSAVLDLLFNRGAKPDGHADLVGQLQKMATGCLKFNISKPSGNVQENYSQEVESLAKQVAKTS